MRFGRFILVSAGILAIVAAIFLVPAWHRPLTLPPSARIYLVGYTNFTLSPPHTNVLVNPGKVSWIRTHMVLTNEGRVSISYGAWGSQPYGWVRVWTPQGTEDDRLAPPFTGSTSF
jgi:hypothetical protein